MEKVARVPLFLLLLTCSSWSSGQEQGRELAGGPGKEREGGAQWPQPVVSVDSNAVQWCCGGK